MPYTHHLPPFWLPIIIENVDSVESFTIITNLSADYASQVVHNYSRNGVSWGTGKLLHLKSLVWPLADSLGLSSATPAHFWDCLVTFASLLTQDTRGQEGLLPAVRNSPERNTVSGVPPGKASTFIRNVFTKQIPTPPIKQPQMREWDDCAPTVTPKELQLK